MRSKLTNFNRILLLVLTFFLSPLYAATTKIMLWHSLAGQLGTELQLLIKGFNDSQSEYVIKPIYKGDYIESLTSFAAAFKAHQPPALVQVFEVGTTIMIEPKGIIKPVGELMKEQGKGLPTDSFFPAVRAYYSEHNTLLAMPLNTSVPALFYNADALAKVGYTAKKFPKTWDEFETLAEKLKKSGFSCVYTSAYPAWILIESFAAIHGLPLIDLTTKKAIYNNRQIVNFLERLLRWQRLNYFAYGGRSDDATILFTSGRCPILSQSSGAYMGLSSMVPFRVGIAALPLDKNASAHRFNNVAGGAALWVTAGQSAEVYQGIAKFFIYLSQPEVQQRWHQNTGYLPLGTQGIYKTLVIANKHPSLLLAEQEWAESTTLVARLGAQNQIRAINDEALEIIFSGIKNPEQAMNNAVKRANQTLLRFARNTANPKGAR